MLPCLRTCRYLPRRHGWTSRRTSSPCWLLGGGIPPWCSGSPWSRSFMWGHHLERYSNPPRCLPFDASHAQRSPVPGASDAWEGSGYPGLGLGRVVPLWSKPALHRRVHGMPIMPIRPPSTFWGCRWFAASWIEKRSRQHTLIGSSPAWPMTGMAFPGAMRWPFSGFGRRDAVPGGSQPASDVLRLGKPSSSKPERFFGTFSERPRSTSPSSLPTASCVVVPLGPSVCPAIDRCARTAASGRSNVRFAWAALARSSAAILAGAMAFDGRYAAEAAGAMPG